MGIVYFVFCLFFFDCRRRATMAEYIVWRVQRLGQFSAQSRGSLHLQNKIAP